MRGLQLIGNLIPRGRRLCPGGEGLGERGRRRCSLRLSKMPIAIASVTHSARFATSQVPEDRPRANQRQYDSRSRAYQLLDWECQQLVHGSQGNSGWSRSSRWACSRKSGSTSSVMPRTPSDSGIDRTDRDGRAARGGARDGGSCQRPQCSRILRTTLPCRASMIEMIFIVRPQ